MSNKNKPININKETLFDLYINQKLTSKEVGQLLDCTSKCVRNYLNKFNIPIRQNSEAVKLERSKWSLEKELERTKKFINTFQQKSPDERRRITTNARLNTNNSKTISKARDTKFKNQTFTKSLAEDAYYKKLITLFNKDDVVRGYIDKTRYPFNCDFYIISKDLFIEYQGHQTHGYEPYDAESVAHCNYLQKMITRNCDMSTWTNRDVNKLNIAKSNKIKLLLIYPKFNTYFVKDGNIINLGKSNEININDID